MKKGESGFTLIEVLVAITITALIAFGGVATATQIISVNAKSNAHMTAVNEVQNAGYWISRDTQMAQSVTADGLTPPEFLILSWTEDSSGDNYQVVYTLEDIPGSTLKKLQRDHSINGGANELTLVAQYIDPASEKTKSEFTNGVLTLTITATVSTASPSGSETRVYRVVPRPS